MRPYRKSNENEDEARERERATGTEKDHKRRGNVEKALQHMDSMCVCVYIHQVKSSRWREKPREREREKRIFLKRVAFWAYRYTHTGCACRGKSWSSLSRKLLQDSAVRPVARRRKPTRILDLMCFLLLSIFRLFFLCDRPESSRWRKFSPQTIVSPILLSS